MRRFVRRVALAAGTLGLIGGVAGSSEFVIRGARIFDGSRVVAQGDVWVRDGFVEAVGEHLNCPSKIATFDGAGMTLLPGLIDSHTHSWGTVLKDALIFGVTTELDMFTDPAFARQIKLEQAQGKHLDMADLRSAGTLVTAPKGHGSNFGRIIPTLEGPEQAAAFVAARIGEGSDFIKVVNDDYESFDFKIPTLSKETMKAVVDAAHQAGKLAVFHIMSLRQGREVIEAGADGLVHIFGERVPDAEFGAFVAAHHAFVTPTLAVLEGMSGRYGGAVAAEDPRVAPYLSQIAKDSLKRKFNFPTHRIKLSNAHQAIAALKAAGVPILAGTDAPNPGTWHGIAMHRELELLVEAGLSPVEALAAATSAPAKSYGLLDRGAIAPGKRADFLLVKGDPTTSISATRDIVGVWKLGVRLDRTPGPIHKDGSAASKAEEEAMRRLFSAWEDLLHPGHGP